MLTPRQADDVAAVWALLGEHKEALADPGSDYEALAVTRAVRALDEIEARAKRVRMTRKDDTWAGWRVTLR